MRRAANYRYVPVYPVIRPSSLLPRPSKAFWAEYPDSSMTKFWCFTGRVALYHGLRMLNVQPGSTFLVPDYFQGTELWTLKHYGLKLKYYKINRDLSIDLGHLAHLDFGSCTAFYLIHYFGHPHPMGPVLDFCRSHKLLLVEDCAVAMFSKYAGRWLGSFGDLAIYSPYKSIGLPHGGLGAVRARDMARPELQRPPLISTLLQIRDRFGRYLKARAPHGVERSFSAATATARRLLAVDRGTQVASGSAVWSPSTLGLDTSRLTRRMAQSEVAESVIEQRRYNFNYLVERLPNHIPILWRTLMDGECPLFLPLIVKERQAVQKGLLDRGVESVAIWSDEQHDLTESVTEDVRHLRQTVMEIPVYQGLTRKDLEHLVDVISSVIRP